MELTIKGDPKEIAALVVEIQERREANRPENLSELSAAMCEIADRLVEVQDPLCNDRELMSETIRDILVEEQKASSTRQKTAPCLGSQQPHQPSDL